MKKAVISDLPILPEEYGKEIYEQVDWASIESEMNDNQRRFINGLIQFYQPEKILELGVSAGGGTVTLLNAMQEIDDAELYSIDNAIQVYRKPEMEVGYYAIEKYSDLLDKKWHLLRGEDPAVVMEEINEKFDFCVIDTCHLHPVETMNFISILPWLKDGAIVIMHDTTVFEWRRDFTFLRMLAPRLLLSAVCAEKYIPDLPSWDMTVSNIAAWQINPDTRRYCQNLFDSLYLPWETLVSLKTCQNIGKLVQKYYPAKMSEFYDESVRINVSMFLAKEFGVLSFEEQYKELGKNTIFYGAGFKMRELLSVLDFCGIEFEFDIWDKNAECIKYIDQHIVQKPDSQKAAQEDQVMIVTIESEEIYEDLCAQYQPLGYTMFHGLKKCLSAL